MMDYSFEWQLVSSIGHWLGPQDRTMPFKCLTADDIDDNSINALQLPVRCAPTKYFDIFFPLPSPMNISNCHHVQTE